MDFALSQNGTKLDALSVPPDVGQTYQVAAQAGTLYHICLTMSSDIWLGCITRLTKVEKVTQ